MVVFATAAILGCRSAAETRVEPTWQDRCGVQAGTVVTGDQAKCIASIAGLPKGYGPWTIVPVATRPGETWSQWRILSPERQQPGPGPCEFGSEIVIDRQTGAVVNLVHDVALAICD